MNKLNHFIFALALCLIFVELNFLNLFYSILFTLIFAVFIDYDHKIFKKKPWFHQRTWIQEPLGFVFIAIPTAFLLSFLNELFFTLVLVPYGTHILLDYLCVFETYPLAPFSKVKKREGLGIFIPNSEKWKEWQIKGVSENYFLVFNIIFIFLILIFKLFLQ